MPLTINKKRILEAMQELPDDATIEQAMYKLHVLEEVSKGMADFKRYSQDEVEEYFQQRREQRTAR